MSSTSKIDLESHRFSPLWRPAWVSAAASALVFWPRPSSLTGPHAAAGGIRSNTRADVFLLSSNLPAFQSLEKPASSQAPRALAPRPLTISAIPATPALSSASLASLSSHECARHMPASGPLHWLRPRPGAPFS